MQRVADGHGTVSSLRCPLSRLHFPAPPRQVCNMLVAALGAQLEQGVLKHIQVLLVLAAGAFALHDVLGQLLRILRAHELRILREPDVDEAVDGRGGRGPGSRVKRRVLDAVPIDLADIEIVADLGGVRSRDVVCCAPDLFGGGAVLER